MTRSNLEDKSTLMIELKNKVDELALHNEYQLRLKDMNYSEKIKVRNFVHRTSVAARIYPQQGAGLESGLNALQRFTLALSTVSCTCRRSPKSLLKIWSRARTNLIYSGMYVADLHTQSGKGEETLTV